MRPGSWGYRTPGPHQQCHDLHCYGGNGFRGLMVSLADRPAAITTIMVSPIARDTASRNTAYNPRRGRGQQHLANGFIHGRAHAEEASRRVSGTALMMSSDRDITKE